MNTDKSKSEREFPLMPLHRAASQIIAALFIIIFGFAAVFVLSNYLEDERPRLADAITDSDLALQGAKLKGFSFGVEGLIADWYWMRALQYIGNKIVNSKQRINLDNLKPLNPRLLYPLLDNATDLDPKFLQVYAYGAIILPAIDAEQAIKFTEKGIADNPSEYVLYQHLGYIYWKLGNYEKAAEIYDRGSQIPNAPPFLKLMAAKMKSDGGSRETARTIYLQMIEQADDDQIKENTALRLLQLDSLDERDAIRIALQNFKTQSGRCADNFAEIFSQLKTVKLPNSKNFRADKSNNLIDPSGAPYILDKEKCDVLLDTKTTRIPFE